jgi:hypothetical protein
MTLIASLLSLLMAGQLAAPPSESMTNEAESLAAAAQATSGKVAVQNMQPFGPGWSGGAQLFWGVTQQGAQLRLSFSTSVTGRYEVFLHFTRAPDFSFVRASLDGAPAVPFNGYATTVSRDRALLGMRDLAPGSHELLLEVAMKDGHSQGFNVGLDRIELVPVAAAGRSADRQGPPSQANRQGAGSQAPAMAVAAQAVPILQVPPNAAAARRTVMPARGQILEPMSMAARIDLVQRTLSQTSTKPGEPGETLRLSAATPRVINRARLLMVGGSLVANFAGDGALGLTAASKLTLDYMSLQAHRPHLLDCGVQLSVPSDINVSTVVDDPSAQAGYAMKDLSTLSLPAGNQRLLLIVVPAEDSMALELKVVSGTDCGVSYCELTPFK